MNFTEKKKVISSFKIIIYLTGEFNFVKDIKQFFGDFKDFQFLNV